MEGTPPEGFMGILHGFHYTVEDGKRKVPSDSRREFLRVMTETGKKEGEKLSFRQALWVAMGGQM
ncbi:MAG TPA: hypothetical protein H9844_04715 [Candidatus Evtepia faecigallinarum]|nr:hypothetical protein [Candidatus Evtepia faecigallinarum]